MSKKYLNSILIVFLIVIWGSVIYKYFGKQSDKQLTSEYVNSNHNYQYDYKMVRDTFKLKLTNPNPFKASKKTLKTRTVKANNKPTKKKQVKNNVSKAKTTWPLITYHGFVKGDKKATRLILLKINNRLYRKREKETIKGVSLIKAYNDSLLVSFNNSKKTIQKIHD